MYVAIRINPGTEWVTESVGPFEDLEDAKAYVSTVFNGWGQARPLTTPVKIERHAEALLTNEIRVTGVFWESDPKLPGKQCRIDTAEFTQGELRDLKLFVFVDEYDSFKAYLSSQLEEIKCHMRKNGYQVMPDA